MDLIKSAHIQDGRTVVDCMIRKKGEPSIVPELRNEPLCVFGIDTEDLKNALCNLFPILPADEPTPFDCQITSNESVELQQDRLVSIQAFKIQYMCRYCKKSVIQRGLYKCIICTEDYDICKTCFEGGAHDPNHVIAFVRNTEQLNSLRTALGKAKKVSRASSGK